VTPRAETRFRCRVIDASTAAGRARLVELLDRHLEPDQHAEDAARAIIEDVRRRGDRALVELTKRHDGVSVAATKLRVSAKEIAAARAAVPAAYREALERAQANLAAFHARQTPSGELYDARPGVVLGSRVRPLDAVGIYVPGGRASYPSTVLMTAVPAKLAGVPRIAMVTPPGAGGAIDPRVLCAAAIAGVDEIYRVGGAQAVAALAYGTGAIAPVAKIVGPGNAYVTAAKRLVYGRVGIDGPAGPSEVVVVADAGADPVAAASDLLAQAEHDPDAFALAFVVGVTLARAVAAEVERQAAKAPRRAVIRAALAARGGVAIVKDLGKGLAWAHRFAPEHLVVLGGGALAALPRVGAAGSIFLGPWSPVTLGDYYAGPNHVLPTAGAARFTSGLSVWDFVTISSVTHYDREALAREAADVTRLAEGEGLFAHAEAVRARLRSPRKKGPG
jgi:histidinol dehydrogenase